MNKYSYLDRNVLLAQCQLDFQTTAELIMSVSWDDLGKERFHYYVYINGKSVSDFDSISDSVKYYEEL